MNKYKFKRNKIYINIITKLNLIKNWQVLMKINKKTGYRTWIFNTNEFHECYLKAKLNLDIGDLIIDTT